MKRNIFQCFICLLLGCFFLSFMSSCSRMTGMPQNIVLKPIDKETLKDADLDSVTVIATKRFKAGIIKPIFQGRNYRKAWATPIKIPTINLTSYDGGLTPIEKGGGMQTLSMDLQGQEGIVYTLRSVNKNPEDAVPELAKKIKLEDIVMDAMSAQHPYGAVVVAELADGVGLLHTHPKLFYLPSQEKLGIFNDAFKDKIFLLEYEPEGSGEWVKLDHVKEIIDTEEVQKRRFENSDHKIDERSLVRARLFDLLIGDWDRHAKQWGWIVLENDTQTTYTPLPTDRDNAFYNPGGFIPWLMTRPFITPFIRPFRKKIGHMKGLVKPFDQYFLLDTPKALFKEVALDLQKDLTDEEIENAFKIWPMEFQKIDAKKMIKRIKARRKRIVKYAAKFKSCIDKKGKLTVPLKGSSEVY